DGPDVALDGGGTDENLVSIVYDTLDRRARVRKPPALADPNNGPTWFYRYDANGNPTLTTPPRGLEFASVSEYDAIDRLVRKARYNPSPGTAIRGHESTFTYYGSAQGANSGRLKTSQASDTWGAAPFQVKTEHSWNLRGLTVTQTRSFTNSASFATSHT